MKLLALTAICLDLIFYGEIDIYPETAKVVETDNNIVIVETYHGDRFSFLDNRKWDINDICSMIMYGNDTDTVTDDTIVFCTSNGTVEDWTK